MKAKPNSIRVLFQRNGCWDCAPDDNELAGKWFDKPAQAKAYAADVLSRFPEIPPDVWVSRCVDGYSRTLFSGDPRKQVRQ